MYDDDFEAYTREDAIKFLNDLDDDSDIEEDERENYSLMSNEELEAELCLCGAVHDSYMKGVYDTREEAEKALTAARQ